MSEVQADNKHPADELAEIRIMLRGWKDREEELRLLLIEMPKRERQGKKYTAAVNEESRRRLNVEALENEYGDLSRFYTAIHYTTVRINRNRKK